MKRIVTHGAVGLFAAAALLAAPTAARQGLKIDGYVLDSDGNRIEGVSVKLWQSGKPSGVDDTDDQGYYQILFAGGQPVSRVEYTHQGYDPGEDLHLSERRSHSISKVLYRPGQPRPFSAKVETISAIRNSYLFALNSPVDQQRTIMGDIDRLNLAAKLDQLPLGSDDTTNGPAAEALELQRQQVRQLSVRIPR